MGRYWESRRHLIYYKAIFQIVSAIGNDAQSIIDIGSHNTEYIIWFYWIKKKVQLNKKKLLRASTLPGVERISIDYYDYVPENIFDVVLCLQVLEHVSDPAEFCRKLQMTGKRLVVSVPYKWPAGLSPGHIHDPVDEMKLKTWMGRSPNYSMTVTEPFGPTRLIAYYDLMEGNAAAPIPRQHAREVIAERAAYMSEAEQVVLEQRPKQPAGSH
jgi:hypothetical protein